MCVLLLATWADVAASAGAATAALPAQPPSVIWECVEQVVMVMNCTVCLVSCSGELHLYRHMHIMCIAPPVYFHAQCGNRGLNQETCCGALLCLCGLQQQCRSVECLACNAMSTQALRQTVCAALLSYTVDPAGVCARVQVWLCMRACELDFRPCVGLFSVAPRPVCGCC
jgi:hypothetical protein